LFCWYCAHPDFPSFPTRRSSDLEFYHRMCFENRWRMVIAIPLRNSNAVSSTRMAAAETCWKSAFVCRAQLNTCIGSTVNLSNGRSEEHTSELQSRENLVCRLLLE